MQTHHTTVPLDSIGCGSIGRAVIERSLQQLPGVLQASVNPITEMAYVEYDPALCSEEEIGLVVRGTGYGETRAARSHIQAPVGTPVGRTPVRRFALAGGLWLTAVFTLCAIGATLFPYSDRWYRLWALLLPGIGTLRWATYLLGITEAFALGFLSAWLFAWIYNVMPLGAARSTRAAHALNQPVSASRAREAL